MTKDESTEKNETIRSEYATTENKPTAKESLCLLIYHIGFLLIMGLIRFIIEIALIYEIYGDYNLRTALPFFRELMYLAIVASYVLCIFLAYKRSRIADLGKIIFHIIYWLLFLIFVSYSFWVEVISLFGSITGHLLYLLK